MTTMRETQMRRRRDGGFTLIEMMIAVLIIGVLLAIAVPAYQGYVERARLTEAKTLLLNTAQELERCYSTYGQYNDNNCGLIAGGAFAGTVTSEGDHYAITPAGATINAASFDLQAVPQGIQANESECGTLTLDEAGGKGAVLGTVDNCW